MKHKMVLAVECKASRIVQDAGLPNQSCGALEPRQREPTQTSRDIGYQRAYEELLGPLRRIEVPWLLRGGSREHRNQPDKGLAGETRCSRLSPYLL